MKKPYNGSSSLYTQGSLVVLNVDLCWVEGDVPLEKEHAPFNPLLFPFCTIVVVQTDITELVEDGKDSGIKASEDLQVLFVPRGRGHGNVGWMDTGIVGCARGYGGLHVVVGIARDGWGAGWYLLLLLLLWTGFECVGGGTGAVAGHRWLVESVAPSKCLCSHDASIVTPTVTSPLSFRSIQIYFPFTTWKCQTQLGDV